MQSLKRFLGAAVVALLLLEGCASPRAGSWELLGRKDVSFSVERDHIDVGRAEGRFREIQIVVEGAPVEVYDVRIVFGDGSDFRPTTRFTFAPGSTSRQIDLPGRDRFIRRIEFVYRKTSGVFRRATVTVYGR